MSERTVRDTLTYAGTMLGLVVAVVVLYVVGQAENMQITYSDPIGWLSSTDPVDAVIAVLRLVAFAGAVWMLGTSLLYSAARLLHLRADLLGRLTVPTVRHAADRAIAFTMLTATAVGGTSGVAVAQEADSGPDPDQTTGTSLTLDTTASSEGSDVFDADLDASSAYSPTEAAYNPTPAGGQDGDIEDLAAAASDAWGVGESTSGGYVPTPAGDHTDADVVDVAADDLIADEETDSRTDEGPVGQPQAGGVTETVDTGQGQVTTLGGGDPADGSEVTEVQDTTDDGAAAEVPVAGDMTEHTVSSGENLWVISAAHLAESTQRDLSQLSMDELIDYWTAVVEMNADRVQSGNPDLIYPGETIMLPAA